MNNVRVQGRMQLFRKIFQKALNRDLTLPLYGRGAALQSAQHKYGFTKPKHIRGDKTLKNVEFWSQCRIFHGCTLAANRR